MANPTNAGPPSVFRSVVGALLLTAGWLVGHGAAVEFIDGKEAGPLGPRLLVFVVFLVLAAGGGACLCRRWALVSAIELLSLAPFWGVAALHAGLWGKWGTAAAWCLLAVADILLGAVFLAVNHRRRRPGPPPR